MHSETVSLSSPPVPGDLDLEVDPSVVDAGLTASVPGRVRNLANQEVRVILRVRGLPAAWCPPAQVLTLPANNLANVFQPISPPVGTPPGRYQWTLTAETAQRPMRGVTSEFTVRRAQPRPARAKPQKRNRWLVPTVALAALASVLAAILFLRHPEDRPPQVPSAKPSTTATSGPTPSRAALAPTPPITVTGTIQAENAQYVSGVQVELTRLRSVSLSNLGSQYPEPAQRQPLTVKGKKWSLRARPGVYAMRFSMPDYQPQTIIVDTGLLEFVPVPPVQLRLVASPEDEEADDQESQ